MHIRAAHIKLYYLHLILLVDLAATLHIFIYCKAAYVGYDWFAECGSHLWQLFADHLLDSGILEPYGIDHPGLTFRHSRKRIPETRMQGRPLERDRAEDIDIIIFRHSIAETEASACGNHGVVELDAAELHAPVAALFAFSYLFYFHISSSFVNTGPSLQILFAESFVSMLQHMHAPKPQPILDSRLTSPGKSSPRHTARSIGVGPQA